MRVGIDARMLHYQRAGIATYVSGLLRGLRAVAPDLALTALVSARSTEDVCTDVPQVRILTPPHHRWEQITLPLELMLHRFDVLHSPDFIPPFRRGSRSVITVHDLAFLRFPHLLTDDSRRYYGQIGNAVKSADVIIAVSQATRRDLVERVGAPADRIVVILEAADPTFQPASDDEILRVREHYNLPEDYFLFVGTLEPRKNLAGLFRAYARLRSRSVSLPVLAIGGQPGWLAEDLPRLVGELKLNDYVHFLGRVRSEFLPALYSGATALVYPSLYEGFGLPALEAMACGTPVIASSAGALPEVCGNAAILVDPLAISELANAMDRVARQPSLRQELVGLGFARVAEFTWEATATATLDAYRRAAP
ncbi:MAG TPA: glycosyltransferase family 1 protein [Chloroflexota bacterium]|nr:glycosyltransferase family 1 protein [Chloroflexota bacterium]